MSKLEELIQQYCPDGVEYVRLGDVLSVNRGKRLTKTQLSDDGKYFVYHGSKDTPLGKYSQFNVKGKTTIVVNTGGIGGVKFCDENFWCSDGSFWIGHSSLLNDKYVYYYLSPKESYFASQKRVGGVPTIDRSTVENVEIPVPPLPVQEEIVRILDNFTELQAELQAELQKRLQQYNYYRDNLLSDFTPEQEPKECTLEEITTDIYSGATPSKEKRDYWENGTIPWMSSGEVNLGQVYEVEGRITQLGYDKCSTRMVPEGSVVIALAGQGKTRGTVAILRTSVCTNQSLAALVPNPDIVSGEYLYYYLKTQYSKLREVSSGDGTRGGLNLKMLRSYKVIVPSLKTQTQIVAILDRFETLTNDLSAGLPAEIEKRRQQYEYYRDKLLTFKKKEA